ncbi:non-canonical purine NTP pyrophosphatase [archaeon]|jgi:inosine triphosphate pyrophosphatase|nr:non-canonical purine NTP pyrophosphatase [archaeon]MBT3577989.1 non-canonical purine NTP pyrophosphatase [archaeon]MBT6820592.1 non-canonical purine NTP pyrophosphatase [archaeon]MBT6956527.1 non-canonical purine NTP pyrophosphatase [archaeon]MBT7025843.1 non-canonical purine NTP pyrophosphatase [archaeon]
MVVYFMTGNKGKFEEVREILESVEQIDLDLPEIQELDSKKVIEHKLNEAIKNQEGEFFCEDTSIYIDALNGFPGPLIKWFMGALGNEGISNLMEKYEGQDATAKTVIGYTDGNGIKFFEGELRGKIVQPKGTGFGWDPIFQPEGYDVTFGEMDMEEKNKISMRKKALIKLRDYLEGSD